MHVRIALHEVAALPELRRLAEALDISPMLVVIALLAQADASRNRSAKRLARRVLASGQEALVAQAMAAAGL